jgi:hypothetical protein
MDKGLIPLSWRELTQNSRLSNQKPTQLSRLIDVQRKVSLVVIGFSTDKDRENIKGVLIMGAEPVHKTSDSDSFIKAQYVLITVNL